MQSGHRLLPWFPVLVLVAGALCASDARANPPISTVLLKADFSQEEGLKRAEQALLDARMTLGVPTNPAQARKGGTPDFNVVIQVWREPQAALVFIAVAAKEGQYTMETTDNYCIYLLEDIRDGRKPNWAPGTRRPGADKGGAPAPDSLAGTRKTVYAAKEPIEVAFSDLPGNAKDWITIVPVGTPDDQYGEWFYTDGKRSGTQAFAGLAPGEYEVRTYFNWPDGGYTPRLRTRFTVR